ncbi:Tat pathway signal protein [Chromobacterium violaceum]|uniref:Uncharacterized protein n=3 Tax=Chromobacterium violaceum TaxID=536 RepID=A0A1R0MBD4_CHRVL|nr:hypothetical protein [Chromobacterium violaceum]ATP29631.1 hypothetical protein CRN81_15255 [Chromobacterium violaceum]ATP33539.1 hypothetical protein CR207_15265 [Chromobacterium violaceum]KJH66766.1 hypothetical protein UF16_13920 [Chromobacterium violaceum]KMN48286.1 hypothetical protein VK93_16515 [Chromobacterium violaceum]KMN84470.1 hypothetical protein VL02_19610 [Chromobacterium violaceum]
MRKILQILLWLPLAACLATPARAAEGMRPYQGPLKCSASGMDDMWLDQRLGCLTPGSRFIVNAGGAEGETQDMAYVVNEAIYDNDFYLINNRKVRYFQSFLCVRNHPRGVRPLFLSGDLANALELSNQDRKPAGVGPTSVNISGGDRAGGVATACDPARHPLIVDYRSGKVESVNPLALQALHVYELPYN